ARPAAGGKGRRQGAARLTWEVLCCGRGPTATLTEGHAPRQGRPRLIPLGAAGGGGCPTLVCRPPGGLQSMTMHHVACEVYHDDACPSRLRPPGQTPATRP